MDKLQRQIERAKLLCGHRDSDFAAKHAAELVQLQKDLSDPAILEASRKLHLNALQSEEAMRMLCGIRLKIVEANVLPSSNFMRLFFAIENLGESDEPYVQNTAKHEIRVGYISEEGTPDTTRVRPMTSEQRLPLKYVASDKVEWRTKDIYKGDLRQTMEKTFDLAFDVANKEDQLCFNLMTSPLNEGGAFGSFVTTGAKPSRTYVAHSRIASGNLPTTNEITVSGSTNSTKFRWDVFKEIGKYGSRWAGAFPPGRELYPTGNVVVNPISIWDLTEGLTPTAAKPGDVGEKIMANGPTVPVEYMGKTWNLIPDNTIPQGMCYAQMSRPLGVVYRKPSLNTMYDKVIPEENRGERWTQNVFGASILSTDRINALRIIYKTP